MLVKILNTRSGPGGLLRRDTEHDLPEAKALRLIDAGEAEPVGPMPDRPKTETPPASDPAEPTFERGSAEYLEAWDAVDEDDLVDAINAWRADATMPDPDELDAMLFYEQTHAAREAVLTALSGVSGASEPTSDQADAVDEDSDDDPVSLPTVEELVDANTRPQLNELAEAAGVTDPGKLKDKTAVAAAIVSQREVTEG